AFLDFAVLVAERGEAGAGEVASLVDDAAGAGGEHLVASLEMHGSFREGNGGIAAQLGVDGEESGELTVDGDGEGINDDGRDPGGLVRGLVGERDVALLGGCAGARDFDGEIRGGFDAS